MRLDKSRDPMIYAVQGGVKVLLFLEGDEADLAWATDYNHAAEQRGMNARAATNQPWTITLTIVHPEKVSAALDAAVEVIGEANEAWTERNKVVPSMKVSVTEWWNRVRMDQRPPG